MLWYHYNILCITYLMHTWHLCVQKHFCCSSCVLARLREGTEGYPHIGRTELLFDVAPFAESCPIIGCVQPASSFVFRLSHPGFDPVSSLLVASSKETRWESECLDFVHISRCDRDTLFSPRSSFSTPVAQNPGTINYSRSFLV